MLSITRLIVGSPSDRSKGMNLLTSGREGERESAIDYSFDCGFCLERFSCFSS